MKYTEDMLEAIQDKLTQRIKRRDLIVRIKAGVFILVFLIYVCILYMTVPQ